MKKYNEVAQELQEKLVETLKARFEAHADRHREMDWSEVQERLDASREKLPVLLQMEETGGEPDVVGCDPDSEEIVFFDCSAESPKGRRSLCYDREALDSRTENKPRDSAVGMAEDMGVEILTEEQYRELQELGEFDLKTSSWVRTPEKIRRLGGAVFCDRRYDTVFLYHNGAESYYAARGFRGMVRI